MQRTRVEVVAIRTALLVGLGAMVALGTWRPLGAQSGQAPGGFLEAATSTAYRTPPTAAEIAQFVPASRGRFYFPAPYNTEAYRLTVPADCGGGDCIEHTGYSDWRNINHHLGQPELRVFLSLEGVTSYAGPHLFTINKTTGVVTKSAPLFPPSDPLSYSRAEGWYWSARHPDVLYTHTSSRLIRVNVATGGQEVVLDLNQHANLFPTGSQWRVWSPHSSDTDDVHVGTVKVNGGNYEDIGCYVFKASTNEWRFFPTQVDCFVDKSGRYVGLFDNVDGQYSVDARFVDTLTWTIGPALLDQNGAPGHMDYGHGFMVGEDNWGPAAQALRLWDLSQPWTAPGQGRIVHSMTTWGNSYVQPAFGSSVPTSVKPIEQQYMCSQATFEVAPSPPVPREREVVCFRLDGSQQMLVVAPTLVDMTAPGGGINYNKAAKGNLDTTGEYYVWTANMGGNRLDAFLVRIPHQLLTGGGSGDTVPPTVSVTAPANGATVSGAAVTVSASAADNVGVAGVQFRLDGGPIGAEDTSAPYAIPWNSTTAANGVHAVTATARDAAGNVMNSSSVSITVSNGTSGDTTPPSVSLTAPANGSTVGGTITVSANASDNVGVAGVTFRVDGTAIGGEDTSAPYSVSWNSATVSNGAHSITAVARDAANNSTTSGAFTVTVQNGAPPVVTGGGQPVVWTNLVNTTAWAGALRKTSGCQGCSDAGALSVQRLNSGDGALEFSISKKGLTTWVGLSGGNSGTSGTELRFGYRLTGGVAEVRELNTLRTSTPVVAGDVLRIEISGGVVRYAKNAVVFYTSGTSLSYPLAVDTSLLDLGSEVNDAMITIGASTAPGLVRGPDQSNRTQRKTLAPASSSGGMGTHGSGGVIPVAPGPAAGKRAGGGLP